MTESFGARLRQQREQQHIELSCIADRTKISLSLLEGLERDDLSNWPCGIFRRAFVRAYAQNIGLEPGSVVREFQELYPDPTEVVPVAPASSDGESQSHRPPTRLSCLIDSAISSLRRPRPQMAQETDIVQKGVVQDEVLLERVDAAFGFLEGSEPARRAGERAPVEAVAPRQSREPDLSAVARLCTEFCRVLETREVAPLLEQLAEMLDAVGLIVWFWDPQRAALRPVLAHGYSDELLAKLPRVRRDMDNATAASFRTVQACIVNGNEIENGAVVVPLMTPAGCTGVLAVELRHGGEQREWVRALATIFAAQIASFVASAPLAEAVNA